MSHHPTRKPTKTKTLQCDICGFYFESLGRHSAAICRQNAEAPKPRSHSTTDLPSDTLPEDSFEMPDQDSDDSDVPDDSVADKDSEGAYEPDEDFVEAYDREGGEDDDEDDFYDTLEETPNPDEDTTAPSDVPDDAPDKEYYDHVLENAFERAAADSAGPVAGVAVDNRSAATDSAGPPVVAPPGIGNPVVCFDMENPNSVQSFLRADPTDVLDCDLNLLPRSNKTYYGTPLSDIPNLGCVLDSDPYGDNYTSLKLPDKDVSLLSIIDVTDSSNGDRGFFDRLMRVIGFEQTYRGFNPATAIHRKSFVTRMVDKYGNGGGPSVVHVRLRNNECDPVTVDTPDKFESSPRDEVQLIKFDLVKQIKDLLSDREIFGTLLNCVVNTDDRFKAYRRPEGQNDELMDGTWYEETVARMISDNALDEMLEFVIPLMLYTDKTGTDVNQRYPLEPLVFTLAIIRRHIRNLPRAWRIAAMIPDLDGKTSKATKSVGRNKKSGLGKSNSNYHRCLEHVTQAFRELETEGIVLWLRLGGQVKKVRCFFPIATIAGDGKSADALACRYGSHKNAGRISRGCNCPQKESANTNKNCDALMTSDIEELVRASTLSLEEAVSAHASMNPNSSTRDKKEVKRLFKESQTEVMMKLKGLSAHAVENAFSKSGCSFGGDPRGIFGALPVDLMHAFQSGLLKYLVKIIVNGLTPKDRKELDDLVDQLLGSLRSTCKPKYPRFNFSKGFSSLTLLTSDEWPGMMVALLLVLRTKRGIAIFERDVFCKTEIKIPKKRRNESNADLNARTTIYYENLLNDLDSGAETTVAVASLPADAPDEDDNEEDEEESPDRQCSVVDFIELAEALLSFHSWYKSEIPRHWNFDGSSLRRTAGSVRRLIAMVQLFVPRSSGNGWKLQKIHDILHLAEDMERFGNPKNFDAGPGESGLRYWAKWPARTAQNRGHSVFSKQVASRLYEFQCLAKARRENGVNGIRDSKIKPRNWDSTLASPEQMEVVEQQDRGGDSLSSSTSGDGSSDSSSSESCSSSGVIPSSDTVGVIHMSPSFDSEEGDNSSSVAPSSEPEGEVSGAGGNNMSLDISRDCSEIDSTPMDISGISTIIDEEEGQRNAMQSTWFKIFYSACPETGLCFATEWSGDETVRLGHLQAHPLIVDYLRLVQRDRSGNHTSIQSTTEDYGGTERLLWKCYTECSLILEGGERVILRAHPNYRNDGAWYDWCILNYGYQDPGDEDAGSRFYGCVADDGGVEGCVPAKILAFLWCPIEEEIKVMVHVCEWRKLEEVNLGSVLVEPWTLRYTTTRRNARRLVYRPDIQIVSLQSVVAPCLVMEEEPLLTEETDMTVIRTTHHASVHLVKEWDDWGLSFS